LDCGDMDKNVENGFEGMVEIEDGRGLKDIVVY
jgi:hypothetical protein